MGERIDFTRIAQEALDNADSLIREWFPNAVRDGREWCVGGLGGEAGDSLKINTREGVWTDFAGGPGSGGADLISLRARQLRIKNSEAAAEIADRLRVANWKEQPAAKRKRPSKGRATAILPAPPHAPPATFRHWKLGEPARVSTYRDAEGRILGHVCRFVRAPKEGGEKPEKDDIPRCWARLEDGSEGWAWCGPRGDTLRPLYGLDKLAARPGANVLLVEGEAKADAAAELFPALVVLGWWGGCGAAKGGHVDLAPLAGRKVAIWPDADCKAYPERHPKAGQTMPYWEQPGEQAALELARALNGVAAGVRLVQTPWPPPKNGWDLGDAAKEGWTPEQAMAYLREHLRDPIAKPAEPEPEPEMDGPPPEDGDHGLPERIPPDEAEPPELPVHPHFTALGHDRGTYYYLSHHARQVVSMSGPGHTKLALMQLAPPLYWEREYAGEKGVRWEAAAHACLDACHAVGIWDAARVRGRGCWWDRDRLVLHLGDRLLVNGDVMRPNAIRSGYVYEAAAKMPGPGAEPLSAREARRVVEIAKLFAWERPASAALLCGWIALAPVCGALAWRPHIWLTGGSGSGKTTVLESFVAPLCAGTEISVQGASTEAGIRQRLRADARPVIFDESESNDDRERARIQAILALIRQSSSETAAQTLKGTAGGNAMAFHIRSMFCLASINVSIRQQADHTRIAVLSLRSGSSYAKNDAEARGRAWAELERELVAMADTPEFPGRLLARIVGMIPTIRANIRTFIRVAARHFGSQRLGDQYGTLLAGCYALWADGEATEAQAEELINRFDWGSYTEAAEEDESELCLSSILQSTIRVDGATAGGVTATLGELVSVAALGGNGPVGIAEAVAALGRHGLRVKGKALLVANKADALSRLLRDRPWGIDWRSYLRRIRGSESHGPTQFSPGHVCRATSIPIDAVLPDGEAPAVA